MRWHLSSKSVNAFHSFGFCLDDDLKINQSHPSGTMTFNYEQYDKSQRIPNHKEKVTVRTMFRTFVKYTHIHTPLVYMCINKYTCYYHMVNVTSVLHGHVTRSHVLGVNTQNYMKEGINNASPVAVLSFLYP